MRLFGHLSLAVLSFSLSFAQQNQCSDYQISPDSPQTGPRKFNVIQVDYSRKSSLVLISNAAGQKIGEEADGKRVRAQIPHAFYEDADDAVASSGLPPEKEPEEIVIQYPQAGRYELSVTSRGTTPQWLKITIYNCGKRWTREVEIAGGRSGVTKRWYLIYDPSSAHEPELRE